MSLDDDFWVLSLVTRGRWAVLFSVLMIAATCWQCSRKRDCSEQGGLYLWESSTCVKQDSVIPQ